VIDPDIRIDDLGQPRGAGADEGVRAVVAERAEQLVERARIRQRHQNERSRLRPAPGRVRKELLPVRKGGDRIDPPPDRGATLHDRAPYPFCHADSPSDPHEAASGPDPPGGEP